MDAATIQGKIDAGYAKAAIRVGYSFSIYRPTGPTNPTAGGNLIGSINAAFNAGQVGFTFSRAPAQKDALFTALLDGTQVHVGDYLIGGPNTETFYIANKPPLQPILAVKCNRTLSVSTPGPSEPFGAQAAYRGSTPATRTAVMSGWPANLLFDARGRATEVGLPLDLPSPFYTVMMPAWPGVDVRTGMYLDDDLGRQYIVSASELTALGWRIFAQLAVT